LDDAGEPLPVGQRGNLWVGGVGVSKGYLNLPLTAAEKFRPNKFVDDGGVAHYVSLAKLTDEKFHDVRLW
jgi:non-ribosomal peptide synthetase component F